MNNILDKTVVLSNSLNLGGSGNDFLCIFCFGILVRENMIPLTHFYKRFKLSKSISQEANRRIFF